MTIGSKEVFAKNLKIYMENKGKTQKELAKIVGVSAPTINDWVNAKKYPRIEKIEILANYFDILKSDLIEEKQEITPKDNSRTMGEIIRELRLKQHLTLEECSEELGITIKELQLIENGNKQLTTNTMNDIAHLFGMRSIDLVGLYFFPSENTESFTFTKEYIESVKRWYIEFGENGLTPKEQTKLFEFTRFLVWQRENK